MARDSNFVRVLGRRSSEFTSVAWSPNKKRIAAGATDGLVWIWDAGNGAFQRCLEGHSGPVSSVGWSSDGRLASGSADGTVRIWDAAKGVALRTLEGHSQPITGVAWSEGLLASGTLGMVRVWDTAEDAAFALLLVDTGFVTSLAWSLDGRLAFGAVDNKVRVWEPAKSPAIQQVLPGHEGWVVSVAWSGDGRLASGSRDKTVRIWNPGGGMESVAVSPVPAPVNGAAWSPAARSVAIASDGGVRLWNPRNGETRDLKGHEGSVSGVGWSPDGRLASCSRDGEVRIWEADSVAAVHVLNGHRSSITSVAWSPEGRLYTGSEEGAIKVWDTEGAEIEKIPEGGGRVSGLARSADGKLAFCNAGRGTGPEWATCVAWSQSGQLARGFHNGEVRVGDEVFRHDWPVTGVAWSGDERLATVSDSIVRIWKPGRDSCVQLEGQGSPVTALAWLPLGQLASGSQDGKVWVWDTVQAWCLLVLEGHISAVKAVAYFEESNLLVSTSDTELCFWNPDDGQLIYRTPAVSFLWEDKLVIQHSGIQQPVDLGDGVRLLPLRIDEERVEAVRFQSAKVVLVGESAEGKSCLALRLSEDRYEERGTTHGMQIWNFSPEKLGSAAASDGIQREIFLWDLGGQPEYQLVHQLFLQDTTVAVFVFDPTRGDVAFEDVERWNRRLELQLGRRGTKAAKVLVRSKADINPDYRPDLGRIERLKTALGFHAYLEVSASKPEFGIDGLKRELSALIDWERIGRETKLKVFQDVYERVAKARESGDILFDVEAERGRLGAESAGDFEQAVRSVAERGLAVEVESLGGRRVLILRIDHIERYAGAVILAAKANLRSMPAIEEASLFDPARVFAHIDTADRVADIGTRLVLMQAVVQILIEKSVCMRSQGLLIFPSEYWSERPADAGDLPHRVAMHLEFTGPVNNLYASTVCQVERCERFGRVRLWRYWAEFEAGGEVCGLQLVEAGRRARFELRFNEGCSEGKRGEFAVFVRDHLHREGVEVTEGHGFRCACGNEFSDETVRLRLEQGKGEIVCPVCDRTYSLFRLPEREGRRARDEQPVTGTAPKVDWDVYILTQWQYQPGAKALATALAAQGLKAFVGSNRSEYREVLSFCKAVVLLGHRREIAFVQEDDERVIVAAVDERTERIAARVLQKVRGKAGAVEVPIRILHLSDLHLKASDHVEEALQPLLIDLKENQKLDRVDYLVVSGDLADRASPAGFEKAEEFLVRLLGELSLTAERVVMTPGNHDVDYGVEVFGLVRAGTPPTNAVHIGRDVYEVLLEEEYPKRFERFRRVYHRVTGVDYPLDAEQQCHNRLFEETGIQFLGLNSAYCIDRNHPVRIGLNAAARSNGLRDAGAIVARAVQGKQLEAGRKLLRIAVWHHAVSGDRKVPDADLAYLQLLADAGFSMVLHGDVHELRAGLESPFHRGIHVVGAGAFHAGAGDRPESTPRLYNVLEVDRGFEWIRVQVRKQDKAGGRFEGCGNWESGGFGWFEIRRPRVWAVPG